MCAQKALNGKHSKSHLITRTKSWLLLLLLSLLPSCDMFWVKEEILRWIFTSLCTEKSRRSGAFSNYYTTTLSLLQWVLYKPCYRLPYWEVRPLMQTKHCTGKLTVDEGLDRHRPLSKFSGFMPSICLFESTAITLEMTVLVAFLVFQVLPQWMETGVWMLQTGRNLTMDGPRLGPHLYR